ncbi:MAG TPA: hypothetical protein QF753_22155 [Victivallales bacterium]|nr:hypothetical protein [Victivallales bacterium]
MGGEKKTKELDGHLKKIKQNIPIQPGIVNFSAFIKNSLVGSYE